MVDTTANASEREVAARRPTAIVAGVIGNVLEWYDFAIYAFLVPVLSGLFFTTQSPATAVLLSLAVFGSGFVMRPLGAIIFGRWGDRYGRRSALAAVMVLMGLATFLVGALPTYTSAGIVAPALLVLLRLLQGLASGGEWGSSASFVVEYAPSHRRGFVGSWHVSGVVIGILLGSIVVLMLTRSIGPEAMASYGWRIPFITGGVVALIGLIIRFGTAETPQYAEAQAKGTVERSPLKVVVTQHFGALTQVFLMIIVTAIGSWLLLTYMVTFLTTVVKMPQSDALTINTTGLIVAAILMPLFGALSDRVGRKPLMILGALLLAIFAVPAFSYIASGDFKTVLIAHCVLVAFMSMNYGPIAAALVEMFPTSIRVSGLSIAYNLAQTLFGGFAPFIAQWLVQTTGNILAPSWYLVAGALLSLIALLTVKETARQPLR